MIRAIYIGAAIAFMAVAATGHTGITMTDQALVDTVMVPITDLGPGNYMGFQGGLYGGGSNQMPPDHEEAGREAARNITPRRPDGRPHHTGKYVLLSIGISNATQEFCSGSGVSCNPWSFVGRAASDPTVEHDNLAIVNGAYGQAIASLWDEPTDTMYNKVRDERLSPAGLSENQVQVVWLKVANFGPTRSLPDVRADAYFLEYRIGHILRTLKVRYPNIQQVYVSSRIYAGYTSNIANPEPYAYETAFSVKWVVDAQIVERRTGLVDYESGSLSFAPWVAWGPYLWADGMNPRFDGLTWDISEFEPDLYHPGFPAEQKVADALLTSFKTEPVASCWFLASQDC